MKRQLYATLLIVGVCLTVFLAFVWRQPRVADIYLVPRGLQTNSSGALCLLVGVTNRSGKLYGIGFAAEPKPPGGWGNPALIKHFNACNGEVLQPQSGVEVLVPMPRAHGPWRVAAAYFEHEQILSKPARIWRSVMFYLNPRHYLKFITTPELST